MREETLYEYIFSKDEKKLYKIKHPCKETEKMYMCTEKSYHAFKDTNFLINVFNFSFRARIAKEELNKAHDTTRSYMCMVSLEPHDEDKAMQLFEEIYRKKMHEADEAYKEVCGLYEEFNHAWADIIEENTIKTADDMYKRVTDEYRKYDTELNGLFFNFQVRMPARDIMETYAKLQQDINGDSVLRFENDKEADHLVPNTPDWDEIYEGNCETFLEYFNKHEELGFRRYNDDEQVDFIW